MNVIKSGLLCGIAFISSCSFVSLNPEARDVVVQTDPTSLKNCKYIGDTTVSLWSQADTFQSNNKVETQLDTLAKNQASSKGGNTVQAISEIDSNNQRTYSIYKCPVD